MRQGFAGYDPNNTTYLHPLPPVHFFQDYIWDSVCEIPKALGPNVPQIRNIQNF